MICVTVLLCFRSVFVYKSAIITSTIDVPQVLILVPSVSNLMQTVIKCLMIDCG